MILFTFYIHTVIHIPLFLKAQSYCFALASSLLGMFQIPINLVEVLKLVVEVRLLVSAGIDLFSSLELTSWSGNCRTRAFRRVKNSP